MVRKNKRKGSIIIQVGLLFAACVILTGIINSTSQFAFSVRSVTEETEKQAGNIARETISAIREYPAYKWLLLYWHDHAEQLDMEYDVNHGNGTKTEKKCRILSEHAPGLQLEYADESDIEALSSEDQKLYAEIIYSWLITHINQIKTSHHADFLFLVQTEEPRDSQFFLFSAAEPGTVRGTAYEQIYTLGVTVDVTESQQEAMNSAIAHSSHAADAGAYVDYYAYMDSIGTYDYLVGVTYNQSDKIADIDSRTRLGILITLGCLILLSILCSIGILYFVLKPLKKVQSNIQLYKDQKDSAAIAADLGTIRMRNEIGELSADVVHLTREIDDYLEKIRTITAEEEKIQTELFLASNIQTAMLPHEFPPFPDRHEFDLYASMDPARAVGGDFYDFFMVDEDHLCMVIADVSGKGVPAALFMMVSMIILKSWAISGMTPAEVLKTTNTALCEKNQAEMFVTVWIGILEISTGKLAAANGGHEYPVIKRPDGEFELYKDKHGLALGCMEEAKYKDYELQLEPGSKIFVYTDGVPEATDADYRLFGIERMLKALNAQPKGSPKTILDNVRSGVDEFVKDAEQFDDLTMLCIEYKGKDS